MKELDGTLLYGIFLDNRLKKFVIREYYMYKTDGSQGTASLEGREEENLFNNNDQLEYPYIEKEDDSRYISSGRSFIVLI